MKFALATPGDSRPKPEAFDSADLTSTYAHAYQQVFGRVAPDTLPSPLISQINEASERLGTRPDAYLFSVMHGFKVSCPERRFYSRFLVNESAEKRVIFYRKHAARTYGVADPDSISRIAGERKELTTEMEVAEEIFGGWVVGERVRRGGNGLALLYGNRETAFSPHWLVTEGSYLRWMQAQEKGTAFQKQHRDLVLRVDANAVASLAKIRGQVVASVAGRVILRAGFDPESFRIATPVTNALKFWLGVGSALLQLRLIHGVETGDLLEQTNQLTFERG